MCYICSSNVSVSCLACPIASGSVINLGSSPILCDSKVILNRDAVYLQLMVTLNTLWSAWQIANTKVCTSEMCQCFDDMRPGLAVKVIREINLANKLFERHAQSQLHGFPPAQQEPAPSQILEGLPPTEVSEAVVEIVPSAMHALSQHTSAAKRSSRDRIFKRSKMTVNDVAAQAVLFTRAFEKGYVDRLTTKLQRHVARREDGALTKIPRSTGCYSYKISSMTQQSHWLRFLGICMEELGPPLVLTCGKVLVTHIRPGMDSQH